MNTKETVQNEHEHGSIPICNAIHSIIYYILTHTHTCMVILSIRMHTRLQIHVHIHTSHIVCFVQEPAQHMHSNPQHHYYLKYIFDIWDTKILIKKVLGSLSTCNGNSQRIRLPELAAHIPRKITGNISWAHTQKDHREYQACQNTIDRKY